MSREVGSLSGKPVTVCAVGSKSSTIAMREKGGEVVITTATAMKWPETPRKPQTAASERVVNDPKEEAKRISAAERAEAQKTVLAQPHRLGDDDPRLAFPLGQFCKRIWRNDPERMQSMHAAGSSYSGDIRAVKIARGFNVPGQDGEGSGLGETDDGEATLEEIEEQRANIYGLERALESARDVLRDVFAGRRLVMAMDRLCFDHGQPSIHDEGLLQHGLYRLALHYGHFDPNKFRG